MRALFPHDGGPITTEKTGSSCRQCSILVKNLVSVSLLKKKERCDVGCELPCRYGNSFVPTAARRIEEMHGSPDFICRFRLGNLVGKGLNARQSGSANSSKRISQYTMLYDQACNAKNLSGMPGPGRQGQPLTSMLD